jgi:circadian clock protein KaiC
MVALINYARSQAITMLVLTDIADLSGGPMSVPGLSFSAAVDNILLLRSVEIDNRLQRLLSVIKTRDSAFDPAVRRYAIEDSGLAVGEPLHGVEGTLMGPSRLRTIQTEPSDSATD